MTSLLFGIGAAAILSGTSFVVVLLRASPLLAPAQALPALFGSLFLTIASTGTLLLYTGWYLLPWHHFDDGTLLRISLREGVFLACTVVLLLLLHLMMLLTWWIGLLVVLVFLLVETALHY